LRFALLAEAAVAMTLFPYGLKGTVSAAPRLRPVADEVAVLVHPPQPSRGAGSVAAVDGPADPEETP
jgi:hypothetical protein